MILSTIRFCMWASLIVLMFLACAAISIAVFTVASTPPAWSHESPTGWSYPWSCCSNQDCQMVDDARVHEKPAGYVVDGAKDAEPIPYGDKRIKNSPDGAFHWCAHQAGLDAGKTICLFAPPKGF